MVHDDKQLYLQFIIVQGLQDVEYIAPRLLVVIQVELVGLQEHTENDDDLLKLRRI